MDWSVVFSVILGLFLFNVLRGFTVLIIGLVKLKISNRIGEIDTTKRRTTL
jgi:hypothetical protein